MRRLGLLSVGMALVGFALGAPAATASNGGSVVYLHGQPIAVTPHGRFGVFPTREAYLTHPHRPLASANNLQYGGGIDGIGVTTGAPKVYVVYWGSQWGTATTGSDGYLHFSGDSTGIAPRQQAFFKGAGTGGELWSGVPTQYCEGVAVGSQTCPSNSAHVGYPTGGALAGTWADTSTAAPSTATQAQIAAEAVRAAQHFGNTTSSSNRNAEYVVTSPHGTHPDGFPSTGFCAWHSYTTSSYGDLAYTNMPYVTDAGASCGANFVNAGTAGALDGVTIVGGHEFQETITDQNPRGGWTDTSGAENADKCAWISSGQGASANVTFSTGTFAVQSSWANDFNGGLGGCMMTHPIVTNGGGGPSLSVNDVSVSEGGTLQFTVTKSGTASGTVTVNYATANGTAVAPGDYTAKSGTLSFTTAQTSQTVSVTTINDTTVESNETVQLNLSNATGGATISDNQGTGTIIDNDGSTNQPPVANLDNGGSMYPCATKFINVVANDTDPDGNYPLSLVSATNVSSDITVSVVDSTTVEVDSGWSGGVKYFSYVVQDALGATATGTGTVNVRQMICP